MNEFHTAWQKYSCAPNHDLTSPSCGRVWKLSVCNFIFIGHLYLCSHEDGNKPNLQVACRVVSYLFVRVRLRRRRPRYHSHHLHSLLQEQLFHKSKSVMLWLCFVRYCSYIIPQHITFTKFPSWCNLIWGSLYHNNLTGNAIPDAPSPVSASTRAWRPITRWRWQC